MMQIWKFPIDFEHEQDILLPVGIRIISLQRFEDRAMAPIFMWGIIDPKAERQFRKLYIVGTGHEIPEGAAEYISTIRMGGYVWHFFISAAR